MLRVTWQALMKYKWPKERWPAELLKRLNAWQRANGVLSRGTSGRAYKSGFGNIKGDADLGVMFDFV